MADVLPVAQLVGKALHIVVVREQIQPSIVAPVSYTHLDVYKRQVVKNTMLRLAVKGTSLEGLAEQFKGDTAIAFAHEEDPMSAARILCK